MELAFAKIFLNKYFIGALILLGIGWMAYNWVYDRAYAAGKEDTRIVMQKTIDGLTTDLRVSEKDRKEKGAVIDSERQTRADQLTAHNAALLYLEKQNRERLALMGKELDKSTATELELRRKLKNATPTYVSPKADAACIVPRGFVRFHDLSASGTEPTHSASTAKGAPLPDSGLTDVDTASGLALSTVAATVADNYSECRDRETVIKAWQGWYTGALQTWKSAVELQGNFTVTLPPAPSP